VRPEHWIYTVPLRLRSLFRRKAADAELDEELAFHVERQIEIQRANRLSPEPGWGSNLITPASSGVLIATFHRNAPARHPAP
jgi:hypothetical protein